MSDFDLRRPEAAAAAVRGGFSAVLFDGRSNAPVARLLRDPFGLKSLFYAWHAGALVAASEAKAILALDGFTAALDPAYFAGPAVGIAECSVTPFLGIRALRPGHVMRVSRRSAEIVPYAKWLFASGRQLGVARAPKPRLELGEAAARVREALNDAVAARVRANPRLAVALGSDLGSAVLAEVASRHGVRTVLRPARLAASASEMVTSFLPAIYAVEAPSSPLAVSSRVALGRAAAQAGADTLLDAFGADGWFGASPELATEALWRAGPAARRARERFFRAEAAIHGLPPVPPTEAREPSFFGYANLYEQRIARATRVSRFLFSRSWRERMGPASPRHSTEREIDAAWLATLSAFDASRVVAKSLLASVVLPSLGERPLSLHGVRSSAPFLDPEVVRVAMDLDEAHCIHPRTFARGRVLAAAFGLAPDAHGRRADPSIFGPPPWLAPQMQSSNLRCSDLAQTPQGRELFEALLSEQALSETGIFDPWAARFLKLAWAAFPRRSARHHAVDTLLGVLLGAQALHHVFVRGALSQHRIRPLVALREVGEAPLVDPAPPLQLACL